MQWYGNPLHSGEVAARPLLTPEQPDRGVDLRLRPIGSRESPCFNRGHG